MTIAVQLTHPDTTLTTSRKAVSEPTSSLRPSLRIPLPHRSNLQLSQSHTLKMVVYYQIAGKKVGSHVVSARPTPKPAIAPDLVHPFLHPVRQHVDPT